jgi:hypothetical protein
MAERGSLFIMPNVVGTGLIMRLLPAPIFVTKDI